MKDLISYGLIMGKEFPVTAVAQPPTFVPAITPASSAFTPLVSIVTGDRLSANRVA